MEDLVPENIYQLALAAQEFYFMNAQPGWNRLPKKIKAPLHGHYWERYCFTNILMSTFGLLMGYHHPSVLVVEWSGDRFGHVWLKKV